VPKKTNPKAVQKRPKNVPKVRQETQTKRKSDPKRPNSRGGESLPSALRAVSPPDPRGESLPNPSRGTKSRCDISGALLLISVNS
jgi:hypothetical protein